MFLKSLTIESDDGVIREIPFHKGMNLIVDETKSISDDGNKSGNNVGKTTVLRLINYCLGSSAKGIYQDPEFKNKSNEEVKEFLSNKNVFVTVRLREDLSDPVSREIKIRRNFLASSKKVIEINDRKVKSKDLDMELKKEIFGFSGEKPTFKQIKAKNVRDEAERLINTVKVLGSFGSDAEYEALYLFWLGIEYPNADEKRELLESQKIEKKVHDRLLKDGNKSKLNQFLTIVQRDIEELEEKRRTFNLNADYESDLNRLNEIRARLNILSSTQSQLELRRDLIVESREQLEKDFAKNETSQIEELYAKAKALIPGIQRSYEETVIFHNTMIEEKISYVTQELPSIQDKITQTMRDIAQLLINEKECVDKLQKAEAIDELDSIVTRLNEKYELRGKWNERLEQLDKSEEAIEDIERKLGTINAALETVDSQVQHRVERFNEFFSNISENLYGEKFALSANFEKSERANSYFYKLSVDSLNGRSGTGKKKGEIAAFDIAYVRFADDLGIPCLHFIMHDQMEVVDDNQIVGLLRELLQANCQFIVPMLRDKLPEQLNKPEYQILSLSQEDKLFKI